MSRKLVGLIIILTFLTIILLINIAFSVVKYSSNEKDDEESDKNINEHKFQDYHSEYSSETNFDYDGNDFMMKRNQLNDYEKNYSKAINEINNNISNMRLNEKYFIACPLNENLKFEYIVFNSSMFDLIDSSNFIDQINDYYYNNEMKNQNKLVRVDSNIYLNIKSKNELDKLLNQTIHVSNDDLFIIEKVNVLNSGRYYCIYSSKFSDDEYLLFSHLYLAYDGKIYIFLFIFL
jgi:hypothetical protein